MDTKPVKSERNIRSNYSALYDVYNPLIDQGWALCLWGLALVSLESIGMFFVIRMEKDSHYRGVSLLGQLPPPPF